jgi:dolichol kinase
MSELQNVHINYSAEVVRKGIHLFSLLIPVLYYVLPKSVALSILMPLTLAFLLTDVARLFLPLVGRLYERLFGWLLRPHEQNREGRQLNGASYMLLSAVLCIWLFPKVIVITAFAILIISDSAAALIGLRFGRRSFLAKTLEGTSAFLVTALLVVAVAPKIAYLPAEYLIGAAAAVLGTLVEAAALGIDDNLSIPVSIGAAMWILYALFLPTVDLYTLDRLT